MKIETTISLEPELFQKLNRLLEINDHSSLSELIEDLLHSFLAKVEKPAYDLRELELINKNADRLNQEAEDVLTYQALTEKADCPTSPPPPPSKSTLSDQSPISACR